MSSSAWPAVIAAVKSTATTALAPVRVVRGKNTSNDPTDVVMIGVLDPESDPADAGSFQQTMQTFGGGREEVGTVNGLIVAWNGDSDPDAAATTAFGYLALLEAAVRADPKLGLTAYDYVVTEMQSGAVMESPSQGATTALAFTISYKVRI